MGRSGGTPVEPALDVGLETREVETRELRESPEFHHEDTKITKTHEEN
jgi:hypothetical protein